MKYNVYFEVFGTYHIEVEANSVKEAETKAYNGASICLCHQCAKDLNVELGDIDEITEITEKP